MDGDGLIDVHGLIHVHCLIDVTVFATSFASAGAEIAIASPSAATKEATSEIFFSMERFLPAGDISPLARTIGKTRWMRAERPMQDCLLFGQRPHQSAGLAAAGRAVLSRFPCRPVRDNADRHRFELDADGHVAFSEYRRDGNALTVMHTEVPAALNGRGIGSALVRGLLDIARAQGLKVKPRCPFVAGLYRQAPGIRGFARTSRGLAARHLTQSLPFGKTLGLRAQEPALDFSSGIAFFFGQLSKLLFSLGSHFSLTSLAAALVVSVLFFAWQRHKRGRRIRLRTILRALFPRRIVTHRSNQADIGYLFFNVFVFSVVFGWAILSYQFISNGIIAGLVALLGPVTPSTLPVYVSRAIITADAVSRLRARLLVQSLAQPQGAVVVGIPQSAPHRGSAHPAHQFPRPSGLHLDLRQHPRLLGRGRQRARQLHVRRHRPINTRSPTPTSSWCCSSTPTCICSIRICGFRSAACSAAFSFRPRIIRCTTPAIRNTSTRISARAWRCGTGCSARSMFRPRNASR